MKRHPTTVSWDLPPPGRAPLAAPFRRVNLRELEARPDRFEHHLMVVGTVGDTQLEIATASEPLYFAHRNISDEYAVPLRTGDPMIDAFPFRTFFSDFETGEDVGRVKHKVEQLLLHPHGLLHWPGRLRPPWKPFEFAPGMRKTGLTLVFCASTPTEPVDRPLFVSDGNDGATKQYGATEVPFLLADLARETSRTVAAVADVTMELLVDPDRIEPPRGGYAVVLDAVADSDWHDTDLVHIPAGASLPAAGIDRALVVASDSADAAPPPASWDQTPPAPFPVYEDGQPGALPIDFGSFAVTAAGDDLARVTIGDSVADVPRYWLARFLFRTALHDFRLGYLETYGGLYYDDHAGGEITLGIRGGDAITIPRSAVEPLYRAVAPPGYTERGA